MFCCTYSEKKFSMKYNLYSDAESHQFQNNAGSRGNTLSYILLWFLQYMSGQVVHFNHERAENHDFFFPACLNFCSMCVVLESIASLLLASSTKKYAYWETSLSPSCFAMLLSIQKKAMSSTVPLQNAEKCSDWEKDSSFLMFFQGQGSDVPLPKKQEFYFIPGVYEFAFLHRGGAFWMGTL